VQSKGVPGGGDVSSVNQAGINRGMARGAVWMVTARTADRLLALASTMILARLLVPADFGLIAMATSIVAILELFGECGFDVALIQNPRATAQHYNTVWTFNVLIGAILAVALLAVAGPASRFYSEPRLESIILILAVGSLIQGFENVGVVAFRKELNFRRDFQFLFGKRLISFLVTIPLAFVFRNYWALVAGMVAARALGVLLSYILQKFRPKFSLGGRTEIFHFTKWLMLGNVLAFVNTRAVDIMLGKISGPRELGIFNLAYEIASIPSSALIAPINRAIYPGYAKKADDLVVLRQSYLEVMSFVAALAMPAGVGLGAVATLLVPVVLGPKWLAATPVLIVLSLYGILLALKSNNHYVYLAVGKPRIATYLAAAQTLFLIPLIALGSARAGALGAALAYVGGQFFFSPISMSVIRRVLGLNFVDWVRIFWRPLVSCTLMWICVRFLASLVDPVARDAGTLILPLIGCIAAGALVYTATSLALWLANSKPTGPESRALDLLRAKFPQLANWPGVGNG
jgi:O-antigen/teichoic acid export membrane protein